MRPTPVPISPPPGVVLTEAGRVVAGRWVACDKICSVRGKPQKIGGFIQQGSFVTLGTPRACHAWRDNSVNQYFSIGTYQRLYAYDSTWVQNDITPLRSSGTLTNPFSTTAGSSIVTVVHNLHGLTGGDTIVFTAVGSAVGGITAAQLTGTFVAAIIDANTYSFDCGVIAGATAGPGGGSVSYQYYVPVGSEFGSYGQGWGSGQWGSGTWGSPRSSSSIVIEPRVWSLDHFGQILLASYNGGSIYSFDPTHGQPWPRAALISNDAALPTDCRYVFVTPERFVFALRSGMVVSWCSQGDYTIWTPLATNTANTRTLTVGTKLIAGRVLAPFVSLIWSDAALYQFQYTGTQYVYNSSLIGRDCGLIAPNAVVTVNGVAYWMGAKDFLMFDGAVRPMPNSKDVRKYVYDQLDPSTNYQYHAVYNPVFNYIFFFFTPAGQSAPSAYVIYSIDDQAWWPGTLGRSSGTHFDQGDTRPIMCGVDGRVYQHEAGYDANGAAMAYSLSLGPSSLDDGLSLAGVLGLEFDAKDQAGTITLTAVGWDRLRDSGPVDSQTVTINPSDSLIDLRLAGRYLGFTLGSSDLGGYVRLGQPTAHVQKKGVRR
jgi:hypothetical protein